VKYPNVTAARIVFSLAVMGQMGVVIRIPSQQGTGWTTTLPEWHGQLQSRRFFIGSLSQLPITGDIATLRLFFAKNPIIEWMAISQQLVFDGHSTNNYEPDPECISCERELESASHCANFTIF
jgi:hypothetical protein